MNKMDNFKAIYTNHADIQTTRKLIQQTKPATLEGSKKKAPFHPQSVPVTPVGQTGLPRTQNVQKAFKLQPLLSPLTVGNNRNDMRQSTKQEQPVGHGIANSALSMYNPRESTDKNPVNKTHDSQVFKKWIQGSHAGGGTLQAKNPDVIVKRGKSKQGQRVGANKENSTMLFQPRQGNQSVKPAAQRTNSLGQVEPLESFEAPSHPKAVPGRNAQQTQKLLNAQTPLPVSMKVENLGYCRKQTPVRFQRIAQAQKHNTQDIGIISDTASNLRAYNST